MGVWGATPLQTPASKLSRFQITKEPILRAVANCAHIPSGVLVERIDATAVEVHEPPAGRVLRGRSRRPILRRFRPAMTRSIIACPKHAIDCRTHLPIVDQRRELVYIRQPPVVMPREVRGIEVRDFLKRLRPFV